MESLFFIEDLCDVTLGFDGFYLTPSNKFYNDWYNVLELESYCKLYSPETFKIIDGIDKRIFNTILSKVSIKFNRIEYQDGVLYFVADKKSIEQFYKEMKLDCEIPDIKVKFVECLRDGWQYSVNLFNDYMKHNDVADSVASKIASFIKLSSHDGYDDAVQASEELIDEVKKSSSISDNTIKKCLKKYNINEDNVDYLCELIDDYIKYNKLSSMKERMLNSVCNKIFKLV